jgi:hypothetical protein
MSRISRPPLVGGKPVRKPKKKKEFVLFISTTYMLIIEKLGTFVRQGCKFELVIFHFITFNVWVSSSDKGHIVILLNIVKVSQHKIDAKDVSFKLRVCRGNISKTINSNFVEKQQEICVLFVYVFDILSIAPS